MDNLNELMVLLAEKLGVAFELVEQNATYYILEYGKFMVISNIPLNILLYAILIGGSAMLLCLVKVVMESDFDAPSGVFFKTIKPFKPLIKIYVMVTFVLVVIWDIFLYLVSPEVYSIRALMDLMAR